MENNCSYITKLDERGFSATYLSVQATSSDSSPLTTDRPTLLLRTQWNSNPTYITTVIHNWLQRILVGFYKHKPLYHHTTLSSHMIGCQGRTYSLFPSTLHVQGHPRNNFPTTYNPLRMLSSGLFPLSIFSGAGSLQQRLTSRQMGLKHGP